MQAILRRYPYDAANPPDVASVLTDAQDLHASQGGYVSSLVVDDGRHLIAINLWETEQAAAQGRAAIGPKIQRLFEPLMSGPSELVAVGTVLATDLTRSSAAQQPKP